MKIQHVPIEYIHQVWPKVVKFIDAAITQQSGEVDYSLEQVRTLLTLGQWVLLVFVADDGVIKGAATVHIFNRPSHRVAFITYLGGRSISNQGMYAQFCNILKALGATQIEGAVNDSVARLWRRFGFAEKYKIVSVTL